MRPGTSYRAIVAAWNAHRERLGRNAAAAAPGRAPRVLGPDGALRCPRASAFAGPMPPADPPAERRPEPQPSPGTAARGVRHIPGGEDVGGGGGAPDLIPEAPGRADGRGGRAAADPPRPERDWSDVGTGGDADGADFLADFDVDAAVAARRAPDRAAGTAAGAGNGTPWLSKKRPRPCGRIVNPYAARLGGIGASPILQASVAAAGLMGRCGPVATLPPVRRPLTSANSSGRSANGPNTSHATATAKRSGSTMVPTAIRSPLTPINPYAGRENKNAFRGTATAAKWSHSIVTPPVRRPLTPINPYAGSSSGNCASVESKWHRSAVTPPARRPITPVPVNPYVGRSASKVPDPTGRRTRTPSRVITPSSPSSGTAPSSTPRNDRPPLPPPRELPERKPWSKPPVAVSVDIETHDWSRTAFPRRANHVGEIVQIAWAAYDADGAIVEEERHVVRPAGFAVSERAAAYHGITTERAIEEGVDLGAALDRFAELVAALPAGGGFAVSHNMSHEDGCLSNALRKTGRAEQLEVWDRCRKCSTNSKLLMQKVDDEQCRMASRGMRIAELHEIMCVDASEETKEMRGAGHSGPADARMAGDIFHEYQRRCPDTNLDWTPAPWYYRGWSREVKGGPEDVGESNKERCEEKIAPMMDC